MATCDEYACPGDLGILLVGVAGALTSFRLVFSPSRKPAMLVRRRSGVRLLLLVLVLFRSAVPFRSGVIGWAIACRSSRCRCALSDAPDGSPPPFFPPPPVPAPAPEMYSTAAVRLCALVPAPTVGTCAPDFERERGGDERLGPELVWCDDSACTDRGAPLFVLFSSSARSFRNRSSSLRLTLSPPEPDASSVRSLMTDGGDTCVVERRDECTWRRAEVEGVACADEEGVPYTEGACDDGVAYTEGACDDGARDDGVAYTEGACDVGVCVEIGVDGCDCAGKSCEPRRVDCDNFRPRVEFCMFVYQRHLALKQFKGTRDLDNTQGDDKPLWLGPRRFTGLSVIVVRCAAAVFVAELPPFAVRRRGQSGGEIEIRYHGKGGH